MKKKNDKKSKIGWSYDFDFIPYTDLDTNGSRAEEVFVCAPEGICKKESKSAVIENLAFYLDKRGKKGWELVQMFPQKTGILLLFKKKTTK